MSRLHGWLEFLDTQTGSPRRVDLDLDLTSLSIGRTGGDLRLPDSELSEIHAILTRERDTFIIRDLGSQSGTFINQRQVVEAALNNLDVIQVGHTTLTFHVAYVEAGKQPTAEHPPSASDLAAPGRQAASQTRQRTLQPFAMFFHPLRFWTQALGSSVFQFRRTWLTFALAGTVVVAGAFLTGGSVPLLHLGFLLFAATLAHGLMAITCSVFFGFDSMPDAPQRLSQSVRFVFWLAPFLLTPQVLFLIWASQAHPRANQYFMAAIVPTLVLWVLVGMQSHYAFAATFSRSLAFALTASVPWNLFMTGLMSFIV